MSKHPECQAHLDALRCEHREVAGTLLSTMDGFEVAASVGAQISPKKMAAMTSSLLALAEAVSRESSVGQCRDLVIESSAGIVLMMDVPSTAHRSVLTVLCTDVGVLGRIRWAARNAREAIAQALDAQPVS
jgi:predicted regulator of Ras-like GTPase activity (Roadblock/LC7/MglB family)